MLTKLDLMDRGTNALDVRLPAFFPFPFSLFLFVGSTFHCLFCSALIIENFCLGGSYLTIIDVSIDGAFWLRICFMH